MHPAMHYVQIPLAAAICAGDTEFFHFRVPQVPVPEFKLIGDTAYAADASGEMPWAAASTHAPRRWQPSMTDQICGHPFLCMATLPELKVAMSAVLHQRCTWGLSHPIAGVAFSPSSTHVAFVLGWCEENRGNAAFVSCIFFVSD